jgi:hypothetical protein
MAQLSQTRKGLQNMTKSIFAILLKVSFAAPYASCRIRKSGAAAGTASPPF